MGAGGGEQLDGICYIIALEGFENHCLISLPTSCKQMSYTRGVEIRMLSGKAYLHSSPAFVFMTTNTHTHTHTHTRTLAKTHAFTFSHRAMLLTQPKALFHLLCI